MLLLRVLSLLAIITVGLMACSGAEPTPVIEPYSMTVNQAALVIYNVGESMEEMQYSKMDEGEWGIVCENFRGSNWDFNETYVLQEEGGASARSMYGHSSAFIWIPEILGLEGAERSQQAQSFLKGFCQHVIVNWLTQ